MSELRFSGLEPFLFSPAPPAAGEAVDMGQVRILLGVIDRPDAGAAAAGRILRAMAAALGAYAGWGAALHGPGWRNANVDPAELRRIMEGAERATFKSIHDARQAHKAKRRPS